MPQSSNKPSPFKWKAAPTPSDPDHVTILEGWDRLNITSFACEELARWTHGKSRIVTMNHQCRESFLGLWAAWEKAGVLEQFPAFRVPGAYDGWAGAYNPRYKRGVAHDQNPNHLSNHASGHAFDIAAQRYPLGREIPGPDLIHLLVPIAKSYGWRWGGEFTRRDGMHFQHETSPFT